MSADERTTLIYKILSALAAAEGKDVPELEYKLAEYIDPDVISDLATMDHNPWSLTFTVADHEVRINHDGEVSIDGAPFQDGKLRTDEDL